VLRLAINLASKVAVGDRKFDFTAKGRYSPAQSMISISSNHLESLRHTHPRPGRACLPTAKSTKAKAKRNDPQLEAVESCLDQPWRQTRGAVWRFTFLITTKIESGSVWG